MQADRYRTEVPALIEALTAPALVARYQGALAEERAISAERSLAEHLQRMGGLAARLLAHGFDALAREDRQGADELVTDIFAVATWRGWELPVEAQGRAPFEPADLCAGLLASGGSAAGASLYRLDAGTVALVRGRTASPG